ncbi:MAG: hypothetical protein FJ098_06210, partial [Deltaproteobacteria bacterium]|nr:hypothetical protein [Deltaproteobacteria bacterium]
MSSLRIVFSFLSVAALVAACNGTSLVGTDGGADGGIPDGGAGDGPGGDGAADVILGNDGGDAAGTGDLSPDGPASDVTGDSMGSCPGNFGCPCEDNGDCFSGYCVETWE